MSDDRLQILEEKTQQNMEILKRLENAVIGDQQMGVVGIAEKINSQDIRMIRQEKRISKIEKQIWGASAIITFIMIVATLVEALGGWIKK